MKSFLKTIRNHFLRGLLILLPSFATLYISYHIFWFLFRLLDFCAVLVPLHYRSIPIVRFGITLGIELVTILVMVILICLFGWGIRTLAGRVVGKWIRSLIVSLPLVRSIYRGFEQLLPLFFSNPNQSFSKVVLLSFPHEGSKALGFITSDTPAGAFSFENGVESYMVFVPGTPNPTNGFLMAVPKDQVEITSLTVEQGLKLIISAGVLEGGKSTRRRRRRATSIEMPTVTSIPTAGTENPSKTDPLTGTGLS